jgi:hypothetical protein
MVAACYASDPQSGLLVEVLAVCGRRPVQATRLLVGDLLADKLMMPRSAKAARSGSSGGRSQFLRPWLRSCSRLPPTDR